MLILMYVILFVCLTIYLIYSNTNRSESSTVKFKNLIALCLTIALLSLGFAIRDIVNGDSSIMWLICVVLWSFNIYIHKKQLKKLEEDEY